jgi:signal transduction histidine kinase
MLSAALDGRPSALGLTYAAGPGARCFALAHRRRVVMLSLGTIAGYLVGATLGLKLGWPATQIAALWPPIPALVPALLLAPRRLWWAVVGAALPALLLALVPAGAPTQVALLDYVANAGQALLIAFLLQRFCGGVPRFDRLSSTAWFVGVAAILAPATVSLLRAIVVVLVGWAPDVWSVWSSRFLTDALFALTLLPPALLLLTSDLTALRRLSVRRGLEAGLLALSLVAFGIVEVGSFLPPAGALPFRLCPPLALFLWAGLRFGVVGVSISLLIVAAVSPWDAGDGAGWLAGPSPTDALPALQLVLIQLGLPAMLLAALIDERRDVERNLQESNERAHSLAGKLIRTQEQERTLIARELHDEIGQALTVVKINLDTMRLMPDSTAQSPLLDEGAALVEQAIEQVRDLSLLLRPAMLEHLGLVAALRWLVKTQAQRVGYHASFTADELPVAPAPDVEITCYRVLQEALTNIARHARARNVSVALQVVDRVLRLTIRDDGEGFELAAMRRRASQGGSVGLLSLEERASLANGRLSVVSAPGRGTTLILTLPFAGVAPAQPD